MKIYFTFSRGYTIILCVLLLIAFSVLSIASNSSQKITVENEAQRVLFLEQYGFIVGEPISVKTITVPLHFDSEYSEYNEKLKSGGYDHSKYKGMNLIEYTYHSNDGQILYLISDQGKLVSAHCLNLENFGIHPLAGELYWQR